MDLSFYFKWYDMWVGIYVDNSYLQFRYSVYIQPIPMFGLRIRW